MIRADAEAETQPAQTCADVGAGFFIRAHRVQIAPNN